MTGIPPPNYLGAPLRYDRWRPKQDEALLQAVDSPKRFVVICAPTAFGKSLVYTMYSLLTDNRTGILTSTKALQDQLYGDFEVSGMLKIMGLGNYECVEGGPTGRFGDVHREGWRADRGLPMTCDEAPCQSGAFCAKREGGCTYYDAYRRVCLPTSKLFVTNYAYWMSINKYGDGIPGVDTLVCDEAHNAIDEVGSFIGTEIKPHEIEAATGGTCKVLLAGADFHEWKGWASYWLNTVSARIDELKMSIRDSERMSETRSGQRLNHGLLRKVRDLKRVQQRLQTVAGMMGEWIIDWNKDGWDRPVIKFDPVWPGEYAESVLFRRVRKVILVSATVRPETAHKLGIDPREVDFREYPSPIPKERRPVIFSPAASMNKRQAGPESKQAWSTRIDQIIDRRIDRKGIIHTVSYPRSRELYMGSRHKERMVLHDSTNTREVIEQFKRSKEPLVLVSPVLDTGYDFPYEAAEYQIISKMPFPVTVDKVVKARAARDKGYRDYVTMVTLVQMAGRICRSEDDSGETIIVDADFEWWYRGAGHRLCAKWFTEAVRAEQILGQPLPKLVRGK